jgi:lysophospholipase
MELIDMPANPCPPGGQIVSLRTSDGLNLRAAYWRPEGVPRGAVAVIQGRAEFIEKYFEVISELLSRGFVVATFDWRGQGLSDRLLGDHARGHVHRSTDYRLDLEAFVRQLLASDCPKPWFALAHSMGAAATLDYVAGVDAPFARIVGVAPMLGINGFGGSKTARHIAGALQGLGLGRLFIPGGGPRTLVEKPFEDNILTSDQRRFERSAQLIALAPALGIGDPTIGWLNAAYVLMERLNYRGFAESIRTPVLTLAAGGDRLVSSAAVEHFTKRLKNADCLVMTGSRHEIMMERAEIRAKFWAAVDAFLPGEALLKKEQAPVA